jgi:hypothetical protein
MEIGTCHFTHGFQVLIPKPLEVSIRAISTIESMEVGTCHFTHGFQVLSPEPLEVSIRAHLDHREHGSWDLPLHTWVPSLKSQAT